MYKHVRALPYADFVSRYQQKLAYKVDKGGMYWQCVRAERSQRWPTAAQAKLHEQSTNPVTAEEVEGRSIEDEKTD